MRTVQLAYARRYFRTLWESIGCNCAPLCRSCCRKNKGKWKTQLHHFFLNFLLFVRARAARMHSLHTLLLPTYDDTIPYSYHTPSVYYLPIVGMVRRSFAPATAKFPISMVESIRMTISCLIDHYLPWFQQLHQLQFYHLQLSSCWLLHRSNNTHIINHSFVDEAVLSLSTASSGFTPRRGISITLQVLQ